MSASLVGSEMCIRDSSPTACCRPNMPNVRKRGAFRRVQALEKGHSALLAVSYTHLTLPTICSV
eukprot:27121-Alexandrium_andersonii.AAC.1